MNNEKGIIMPLTLVISLIIATLLLHFAHRLENQVRTYELQRYHLILTLLEKECLSFITTELTDLTLLLVQICLLKPLFYIMVQQLLLLTKMAIKILMLPINFFIMNI